MQRATRDMTTSLIPDNETETINAKCPMGHLDMKGRTSVLQSEASTNVDELEQLCGKLDTASDAELERMKWDFLLAKQKYEHEENEKQRLHEEKMEKMRQEKRSFSQGPQDLLRPLNHYDLFLYCFAIIHVIYSTKELVFYIFQNHYLFCFAIVFLYILKKIFQDCKNRNNSF
ncbi:transmembrane protein 247 [Heliangelus exortis]|uniref:transmembrane protein 247 n=1 Tax=Heliangelus exortis TaxID=472823 RepID=UPI003A936CCE